MLLETLLQQGQQPMSVAAALIASKTLRQRPEPLWQRRQCQ